MTTLTHEKLKSLLHYNQDTGVFTWLVRRGGDANAGTLAGCKHGHGYIDIKIDDKTYQAHRLAFLYVTGEWPKKDEVDHINRIRDDNRWANLREADVSENRSNVAIRSDNKSGGKGVYWRKEERKWNASIRHNGKRYSLGRYESLAEAIEAYDSASKKLHGEFSYKSKEAA